MGIYHRKKYRQWRTNWESMSLCSVIIIHSAWKHSCVIALLLPQIRELSEPQLSLMPDFTGWRWRLLWPFSLGGQPGSQREACPVYPERTSLLLPRHDHCPLSMITVIATTWRDRVPLARRIPVCFITFLYFQLLRASITFAFQQLWLLSEEWGEHLRNCNKNDLRIWKEAWQALLTRLAAKVTSVK